ncbi:hypothetical protein [Kangiella marina]
MKSKLSPSFRLGQTSWKCFYTTAIAGLIGLMMAIPAAQAVCTTSSRGGTPPGAWEAHMNEIASMGTFPEASFEIGNQKIYRMRKPDDVGSRDRWLERLRSMKPRIEELQRHFPTAAEREAAEREESERRERDDDYRLPYMPTPPERSVLIIESELNIIDNPAFTNCAAEEEVHDLKNYLSGDLDPNLFKGLCVVFIRSHVFDREEERKFALSHEWMHTMQHGSYQISEMERLWWIEGSAEWGAHKVVGRTTERDNKIEQFFERQPDCSLTQQSYDAQVFFFWGEQSFGTDWGISLGMGGPDYLDTPRRAAEILPPEQWLDWAISQADKKITMPDGRDLPFQAELELLDLTHSCEAAIEGPPLSVQLREIRFPEDSAPLLTIDPQGAQVAYRPLDVDEPSRPSSWTRVTEEVELEPSEGPLLLAAIMPSGNNLNVQIQQESSAGDNCACHIGRWMEEATADSEARDSLRGALEAIEKARAFVPPEQLAELEKAKRMISSSDTKDRFRFRGAAEQIFELGGEGDVTYVNDGPIVTFRGGGAFSIEDPHTIRADKTEVNYTTYIHSGRWDIEGGALKIDLQEFTYKGTVEGPVSDGPQHIGGSNRHTSYVGGGGDWIVSCEGSGVKLTPADRGNRGPGKDAVLEAH